MMKKRDLKADLEICRKATPRPWVKDERVGCVAVYPASIGKINCMDESEGKRLFYKGGYQVLGEDGQFKHWDVHPQDIADAEFIAQAREGWPHAIERAIEAETLVRELVELVRIMHVTVITLLGCEDVSPEVVEKAKVKEVLKARAMEEEEKNVCFNL